MKDAYFAIPIHESHRNYLCFQYEDKLFRFKALPFGLSSAPYVYTRVTKHFYLEDWIFIADRSEQLEQDLLRHYFVERLGFLINYEKSQLTPSQSMDFLGITIDTVKKGLPLLPGSWGLADRRIVRLSEVAEFVGRVVALSIANKLSIHFLRNLQQWIASYGPTYFSEYQLEAPLPSKCLEDLEWFTSDFPRFCSEPIVISAPTLTVTSDASNLGWGATCGTDRTCGRWRQEQKTLHINEKDYLPAFSDSGVSRLASHMRPLGWSWTTPQQSGGGTKSCSLNLIARSIASWAAKRSLHIVACYRAGAENTEADFLSRNFP
ncbi:hypothetical protein COOONC_08111 [Cooperia oncophora]